MLPSKLQSPSASAASRRFGNDSRHNDKNDDPPDAPQDSRVVLHFDLDAFYVACERELNPQLRGVPVAVSQYNPYGTLCDRSSQDIQGRWVVNALEKDAPTKTSSAYKEDTNGSLIAVSYEARASGVKRNQRGKEACQACNLLNIVQVPVKHGKADLTMYRTASRRVMEELRQAVLVAGSQKSQSTNKPKDSETTIIVEIASIDEVYMDVTKLANQLMDQVLEKMSDTTSSFWRSVLEIASTCTTIGGIEVLSEAAQAANALAKDELRRGSHVQVLDSNNKVDAGSHAWWNRNISEFSDVQLRLVCGAYLAAKARAAVQSSFDGGVFTLSAGISTNKTLAKLASGLKKPNRQTLIYREVFVLQKLFHPLPLGRIRGLGGKWGDWIATELKIETVGQLAEIPLPRLHQVVPKSAQFLFDIARGLCTDPVTPRSKPKSVECSKTFRGPLAIPVRDTAKLEKWVGELCSELKERLQQDKDDYHRIASTMKVSVQFHSQKSFLSKQMRAPRSLHAYSKAALEMIQTLIEGTQQKMSNATQESKNLRITALGVGGMQFLNVAEGSSSILSFAGQESSATRSPSRISEYKSPKRPRAERKRSGMELWLEQSQRAATSDQSQSIPSKRTKTASSIEMKGSVLQYMKSANTPSIVPARSSSPARTKTPAMAMPSIEEVDPEILKALPRDLQQAVLGDIRYQQSQRKGQEKRGIQRFFEPRKNAGRPS